MSITGKCHSGDLTYTINGALGFQFICQCHSCQRLSGSGHLAGSTVQKSEFSFSGKVLHYSYIGGSGEAIDSSVCKRCFSGVFATLDAHPELVVIKAGTLDDPSVFMPTHIMHDDEKAPWDKPSLPKA